MILVTVKFPLCQGTQNSWYYKISVNSFVTLNYFLCKRQYKCRLFMGKSHTVDCHYSYKSLFIFCLISVEVLWNVYNPLEWQCLSIQQNPLKSNFSNLDYYIGFHLPQISSCLHNNQIVLCKSANSQQASLSAHYLCMQISLLRIALFSLLHIYMQEQSDSCSYYLRMLIKY